MNLLPSTVPFAISVQTTPSVDNAAMTDIFVLDRVSDGILEVPLVMYNQIFEFDLFYHIRFHLPRQIFLH